MYLDEALLILPEDVEIRSLIGLCESFVALGTGVLGTYLWHDHFPGPGALHEFAGCASNRLPLLCRAVKDSIACEVMSCGPPD